MAAAKARDIYLTVAAKGWESAEREFSPVMVVQDGSLPVGDFLKEIETKAGLKAKTFRNYCVCFRKIVADVFSIDSGKAKYDYRNGGNGKWLELIHAVNLYTLTPDKVQVWKVAYLKKADSDPIALAKAKRNVNTLIRCSKALFASKTIRFLKSTLPKPLPFDGIEFEKEGSKRYKSSLDYRALITAAKRELSVATTEDPDKPERYKILLLALGAGLRKAEIDTLCWNQIDWENSKIWIGATAYFTPKSTDSQGTVDVDAALLDELRHLKAGSHSEFVLSSRLPPRPNASNTYYRAAKHFEDLNAWLKSKGVTDRKPIHTLRKEFGSLICAQAGIFAASAALRHGSIQVSASHYIDKKQRVTVAIGDLIGESTLKPATRVV